MAVRVVKRSPTTATLPSVQELAWMERRIPAYKIVERIAEGLDTTESKFFHKNGIVTDQRTVVNWSERRQFAQLAAEYGGYLAHPMSRRETEHAD